MVAARNFDATRDANALREAIRGVGTDNKTLINILGNRNTAQRLEIKAAYKNKLNRVGYFFEFLWSSESQLIRTY